MAVATIYTELDIDLTKFQAKQKKLLDDIKKVGADSETALQRSFMNLGVTSDSVYKLMVEKARVSYEQIAQSGKVSDAELVRSKQAMVSQINAINAKMAESSNVHYTTLGMKSAADVKQRISDVTAAATAQQAIVGKSSDDWIRIERAKNEKLKELNKEMVGDHEMSMASMTRALLRFYAAYYVITTAGQAIGTFFMSGIKAIDDMKINVIAVAAQITSMQGTTGDVAENYKKNVEYAKALVPILMQVDAASFANFQQISLMNRAATNHGVILDVNNKKQIEGFTAVTNAVALLTTGQNKEIQASQEINALVTGRIKPTDMVAMSIDGIIKAEGKYKGGLMDIVKLSKQHNDLWERLAPYMIGITAASADIGTTWEAVSSSLQTAWGIIQRGLFQDVYTDLTKNGKEAVVWMKENADDIVVAIKNVYETLSFATQAVIASLILVATISIAKSIIAGDAWAWFALRYEAMSKTVTMATSSMTIGWTVFVAALVGFSIGKYLSNEFEWARFAGISMVYGIIDAWEGFTTKLAIGWERMKMTTALTSNMSQEDVDAVTKAGEDRIAALTKKYEKEKAVRAEYRDQQFKDESDAGKAAAKAASDAAKDKIKTPGVPPSKDQKKDSVKGDMEALRDKIQMDKAYHDEQMKNADQAAELARRAGQDEYKTITNLYDFKRGELSRDLAVQYKNAEEQVALEAKAATMTKDGVAKEFDAEDVLYQKKLKLWQQYDKKYQDINGKEAISIEDAAEKTISTMAAMYSVIAQYSKESIDFQIKELERKYRQEGRFANDPLALKAALMAEEKRLLENADKYWADYYSNIDGYANVSYQKKLDWIEKVRLAEIAAANAGIKTEAQKTIEVGAANAKANQAIITAIGDKFDQENKYTKQVITNAGAMLDAAMTCSDKDSAEYHRLAEWKKAVQIAELAMTAAKNIQLIAGYFSVSAAASGAAVANAGAAVTGASIGVGPTGFATAAAMIALMASVFAMYGIANSGGSSASATVSGSTYTGQSTVLGASDQTGSESISKSWELMQDTYNMEYTQLSGIYREMKDLNSNITGLVTSIIRTGGVTNMNVATGTTYPAWWGMGSGEWTRQIPLVGNIVASVWKWVENLSAWVGNGIFGGITSSTVDMQGIQTGSVSVGGMLAGGGVGAQQYTHVTQKHDGGWFSSDWYSGYTVYGILNENVTNMLDKVFKNMSSTLVDLTLELGTDMNATLNYVFSGTMMNLQGMDSEAINKYLTEYFSALGDNAIEALFGSMLKGYQEVGEGLMETAVRIITDKATVMAAIKQTNQVFYGGTQSIIAFSEAIIDMAGDLDTFTEVVNTYYDKFFSDTEKQANLQSDLTDVLTQLNLTLPATRAGYRNLVESLNLNTDAGQEAYVTLMKLSEEADKFYTGLEDAQQKLIDAQGEIVNTMQGYVDKLKSARESMKLEGTEAAAVVVANAKAIFNAVLVAARGGDFSGIDSLDNVLSTLTTSASSSTGFSSKLDYERNYWNTYNSIAELEGLAGTQLSVEEQTRNLMQEQLTKLAEIALTTTDALAVAREQQATAALQLEEQRTMTAQAKLSEVQAQLEATQAQLTQAQQQQSSGGGGGILENIVNGVGDFFGNIFGWANGGAFSNGNVIPFALGDIVNSPHYFPMANGMGLMGEAGPEAIMPLTRIGGKLGVKSEGGNNNNVILISEVRALREELKAGNLKNGRYIEKTSKWLEKFDNDGIAVRVP